jgi:putative molybdopterin biosynthesis protein
MTLVKGWRRLQGIVYRKGDTRFEGKTAEAAVADILNDETAILVNRNAGAGTRILLDGLLKGQRPDGWSNQPKSHNAVAATIAQGRADWGMAIASVAKAYDLGFLPFADEHYDFAVVGARRERPAVHAFLLALSDPAVRSAVNAIGFVPASE